MFAPPSLIPANRVPSHYAGTGDQGGREDKRDDWSRHPKFLFFFSTKILTPIVLQCMGGRDYLSRQIFHPSYKIEQRVLSAILDYDDKFRCSFPLGVAMPGTLIEKQLGLDIQEESKDNNLIISEYNWNSMTPSNMAISISPRVDPLHLKCPFIACLQQKVIFGIPNIRAALNKTINNNITRVRKSKNFPDSTIFVSKTFWIKHVNPINFQICDKCA